MTAQLTQLMALLQQQQAQINALTSAQQQPQPQPPAQAPHPPTDAPVQSQRRPVGGSSSYRTPIKTSPADLQPQQPSAPASPLDAPSPSVAQAAQPARGLTKSLSSSSLPSASASPYSVASPGADSPTRNPAFAQSLAARQQKQIGDLQHKLKMSEIRLTNANCVLQQWEKDRAVKDQIGEFQAALDGAAATAAAAASRSPAPAVPSLFTVKPQHSGSRRDLREAAAAAAAAQGQGAAQPLLAHLDSARHHAAQSLHPTPPPPAVSAHPAVGGAGGPGLAAVRGHATGVPETEESRRLRLELERLRKKNKELERQVQAAAASAASAATSPLHLQGHKHAASGGGGGDSAASDDDESVSVRGDPSSRPSFRSAVGGRVVTGISSRARAPSSLEPQPPSAPLGGDPSLHVSGVLVAAPTLKELHALEAELALSRQSCDSLTVQNRNLLLAQSKLRHEMAASGAHAGRVADLELLLAERGREVAVLKEQLKHSKLLTKLKAGKGEAGAAGAAAADLTESASSTARKGAAGVSKEKQLELQRTIAAQHQQMEEMRETIAQQQAAIRALHADRHGDEDETEQF